LKKPFFCLLYAPLGGGSLSARSSTDGSGQLGGTMRRDAWWLELLPVIVLLGAFGMYATLRAFEGTYYEWGPYLSPSPFYSPLIDPHHRWWPFSPALLILVWPLGFRVTCYYYRKAYYRAFFFDPPACAVSEGRKTPLPGGDCVPVSSAKSPSLLSLCGVHLSRLSLARRVPRFLFFRTHRSGDRLPRAALQRNPSDSVRTLLPLAPPPGGRNARLLFLRSLPGPAPYGLAMVERSCPKRLRAAHLRARRAVELTAGLIIPGSTQPGERKIM
jgi:hypothetical protein